MATVAKMGFVGSHSQVYYDNLLHRLSTHLQNRVLFSQTYCHYD